MGETMSFNRKHTFFLSIIFIAFSCLSQEGERTAESLAPTHADAAIIIAKKSGLFDRYVADDASLTDCVTFLNKAGIYFGLMEVVNGKEFTVKDCARVMGQVELVFSGEAVFSYGKVILPKDIDSWEDFCTMNGVEYVDGYRALLDALRYSGRFRQ